MNEHSVPAYLVNTGWVGASAQSGAKRISLPITRAIIHAIFDGSINNSSFEIDPYFGIKVPKSLSDIDVELLIPAKVWEDQKLYHTMAIELVKKFQNNFKQYDLGDIQVRNARPTLDL